MNDTFISTPEQEDILALKAWANIPTPEQDAILHALEDWAEWLIACCAHKEGVLPCPF